ncbi:hypothetical protein QOZ80_6BG0487660 [Eleusine coracana subsp. coracana]|nr:hypothetical protein QOZ80_6BG0487660 [Eleusine coracana subsp. coracana]
MHEYPFSMSEHYYFVEFIKSLRPSFPLKSRVTVRKGIMDIFLEYKDKLYAYLKTVKSQFSATMDIWISCQNKSYMCVTIHWVDDEWRLQKRIIGLFHVEGRHTGQKLSQIFSEVMVKWYVEKKLFALTLDNAGSNEVVVKDVIADLKESNGNLVCDGIFFHVRCACHILNLVARDGLSVISNTIGKIKSIVLAVKGSPLHWEGLMKCAAKCGLDTTKGLSYDVSTRWNSTYLMLRDALYFKPAFLRLKSRDCRRYEHICPKDNEWNMAVTLFQCLKKFYDLTELLSGTSYPTANLFYRGFYEIKELVDKWCISDDFTIRDMAVAMSAKFEKYWKKSSTALAVACFLDPRYKKRLIEFYMKRFYGDMYQVELEELLSVITKLYQFYASLTPSPTKNKSDVAGTRNIDDILLDNPDEELENFLYESSGHDNDDLDELDKYMAQPLLKHCGQFDILPWWRGKTKEFSILAKIARDVMAIQVSTVASESAFSAGGRVIDPYRSSLSSDMVEALICTKDWLAAERKDSKKDQSVVIDLELMEIIFAAMKLRKEEEKKNGMAQTEDAIPQTEDATRSEANAMDEDFVEQ